MKHHRTITRGSRLLAVAVLGLLAMGASAAPAGNGSQSPVKAPASAPGEAEAPTGWIVDESDNVCGVRPARQITNPALVRYEDLLDATPEIQRMKREGIRRDSAQGQVLYAGAVDRIAKASRRVMAARSHCSVWKQIQARDGRAIPDISEEVKAEL